MDEMWIVKISFLLLDEDDDQYSEFMTLESAIAFVSEWATKDNVEVSIMKTLYQGDEFAESAEMPF
jgi:hypothetical protein